MTAAHPDHCRRLDCEPKTIGKQQIIRYAGSYAQAKDGQWWHFSRFTGWTKPHPESVALKAALAKEAVLGVHACTHCHMSRGALEAALLSYRKTLARGLVSGEHAAAIRAEEDAIAACISARLTATRA